VTLSAPWLDGPQDMDAGARAAGQAGHPKQDRGGERRAIEGNKEFVDGHLDSELAAIPFSGDVSGTMLDAQSIAAAGGIPRAVVEETSRAICSITFRGE
jgi:hypothetical protein